jgi:hypothetical protein
MIPTLLLGCAATLGTGAPGVYLLEMHRLTALGYVLIFLSPFVLFCTTPMFARSTAARLLFAIAPLPYFIALLMWSWYLQPVGQHVLADRGVAVQMTVGQLWIGDKPTVTGCYSPTLSGGDTCWALQPAATNLPIRGTVRLAHPSETGDRITVLADPRGRVEMRTSQKVSVRTAQSDVPRNPVGWRRLAPG